MTEKLFHVGIKALIQDKSDKILLLKVDGNRYNKHTEHWDIPGGRIQYSGTVEETLAREIEEETGIKRIGNVEFFASVISNHEFEIETGQTVGLVLMIHKVRVPEKSKVRLSDEHSGHEWVHKKEAGKRLANKYPPEFTDLL